MDALLLSRGEASSRDVKKKDCARARDGGEGVCVGMDVGSTEGEGSSVGFSGAVGPVLGVAVLPWPASFMLGVPSALLVLAAVSVPKGVMVRAGVVEALGRGVAVEPTSADAEAGRDSAAEAEGMSGEGKPVPVDEPQELPLAESLGEELAL